MAPTRKTANRDAFSHPSANMALRDKLAFEVGNAFFRKQWVSAPAPTRQSDGLGPTFNARSCQRCHRKDGRGHPPAAGPRALPAMSFTVRLGVPKPAGVRSVPVYGSQLQDAGIAGYALIPFLATSLVGRGLRFAIIAGIARYHGDAQIVMILLSTLVLLFGGAIWLTH